MLSLHITLSIRNRVSVWIVLWMPEEFIEPESRRAYTVGRIADLGERAASAIPYLERDSQSNDLRLRDWATRAMRRIRPAYDGEFGADEEVDP